MPLVRPLNIMDALCALVLQELVKIAQLTSTNDGPKPILSYGAIQLTCDLQILRSIKNIFDKKYFFEKKNS